MKTTSLQLLVPELNLWSLTAPLLGATGSCPRPPGSHAPVTSECPSCGLLMKAGVQFQGRLASCTTVFPRPWASFKAFALSLPLPLARWVPGWMSKGAPFRAPTMGQGWLVANQLPPCLLCGSWMLVSPERSHHFPPLLLWVPACLPLRAHENN